MPHLPLDQVNFRRVLAVCAHPDDESFGLGAVISTLVDLGAEVTVLCLTRGEASTLGADAGDLAVTRATELHAAAAVLGARSVVLCGHPDGGLANVPLEVLVGEVELATSTADADLLLVFDEGGITGHPDHECATAAAVAVGRQRGLPVLAWAIAAPVATSLNESFGAGFVGRGRDQIDIELLVDRQRQQAAIRCHASQSSDNPVLRRRMQLQDDVESLRWLVAATTPVQAG
jgi:LmbE family N-acetylglucosaminyl deacetylase